VREVDGDLGVRIGDGLGTIGDVDPGDAGARVRAVDAGDELEVFGGGDRLAHRSSHPSGGAEDADADHGRPRDAVEVIA
jgi:hypothetical protein